MWNESHTPKTDSLEASPLRVLGNQDNNYYNEGI